MKSKFLLLLALLLASNIFVSAALGAEKNAQTDEGQTEEESCDLHWPGCPCPKDLSGLVTPPEGMSLASGRCSTQAGWISDGSFTFAGNLTLKGEVVFSATEMTDHLDFVVASPPTRSQYTEKQWRQFAGVLRRLRIDIDNRGNFDLPELSGDLSGKAPFPCMEAPAVINVREIEVLLGATDDSGNWLRKYRVVTIGKFGKCKQVH